MKKFVEGKFNQLTREMISEVEHIVCSKEDFAEGLGLMIDALKERKELMDDEIQQEKKRKTKSDDSSDESDED